MSPIEQALERIYLAKSQPDSKPLKELIDALRGENSDGQGVDTHINRNIDHIISLFKEKPYLAAGFGSYILRKLTQYDFVAMYANTGITSDDGLFHSLYRLAGHRLVPLSAHNSDIMYLMEYLFDHEDDIVWLESIDIRKFKEILQLITIEEYDQHLIITAKNAILNAIAVLSQRIAGLSLHPELINKYLDLHNYASMFITQNQLALAYIENYRREHQLDTLTLIEPEVAVEPTDLLDKLHQCNDIIALTRNTIYTSSLSIKLTNLLTRLEQSIIRLELLVLLVSNHQGERNIAIIHFIKDLVRYNQNRFSIKHLFNYNAKLMAHKITDNASKIGEHYITIDAKGYMKMFKKAAIGGFIIAFLATFKILSYKLDLAPLWRAFVDSMIYGLGFVFIHIVHGTVATKQPSMTAAAIASTISERDDNKSHDMGKLTELVVDIVRSQLIAITGNVILALPIALIISWLILTFTGHAFISSDTAYKLLQESNPISSLALFYATTAGFFLFLSGIIAGFYDNIANSHNIARRIKKSIYLRRFLNKERAEQLGIYIQNNLGALMSNFIFGVFLGSAGTLGYILGLPIDIRHIAFSSANFAHGIYNLDPELLTIYLLFISALGVLLIGLMNLVASFTLALLVALKAKDVKFDEWQQLNKAIFLHLRYHPLDFFIPRSVPIKYEHINRQGQVVYANARPYVSENISNNIIKNIAKRD